MSKSIPMLLRDAVWLFMDRACQWTGHRMWHCYNDAPQPVRRLWTWAWGPWP